MAVSMVGILLLLIPAAIIGGLVVVLRSREKPILKGILVGLGVLIATPLVLSALTWVMITPALAAARASAAVAAASSEVVVASSRVVAAAPSVAIAQTTAPVQVTKSYLCLFSVIVIIGLIAVAVRALKPKDNGESSSGMSKPLLFGGVMLLVVVFAVFFTHIGPAPMSVGTVTRHGSLPVAVPGREGPNADLDANKSSTVIDVSTKGDGAVWQLEADPKFRPNVFASGADAMRSLAKVTAAEIAESHPNAKYKVLVFGHDAEAIEAAGQAMKANPSFDVRVEKSMPEQPNALVNDQTIVVLCDNKMEVGVANHGMFSRSYKRGPVTLTLVGPEMSQVHQARVDAPDWVTDFSAFSQSNSANGAVWIRSRSSSACTSAESARHEAILASVDEILPILKQQLADSRSPIGINVANEKRMRDALWAFLIANTPMVDDTYTQTIDRPYGATIYRTQVLIDASARKLATLVEALSGRPQFGSWSQFLVSLTMLAVALTIIYLFLNAATKGYYTGTIRIAVLLLGTIVAVILLLMMGSASAGSVDRRTQSTIRVQQQYEEMLRRQSGDGNSKCFDVNKLQDVTKDFVLPDYDSVRGSYVQE